jgi:hypothetical protein
VFLTVYGPDEVHVRKRSPEGFEIARNVWDEGARTKSVVVGYCIVGRRADLAPSRLPKVDVPKPPAGLEAIKLQKVPAPRASAKQAAPRAAMLPRRPKVATPNLKALAKVKLANGKTPGKKKPK